jgi:Fe-S cluster assembly scaffold protein SufB
MSRTQALERYNALPLPSTSDEHWRFTDLRGFDPESYAVDGAEAQSVADSMLEIDAAGIADATEGGIEIVGAPDGITFAPLVDHELLGTLVGAEDKLTAHNAAVWQHGLLVHVPAGVELSKPLYVRVGNSTPKGSLF